MNNYFDVYNEYKSELEKAIHESLSKYKDVTPSELFDAMEYSVCDGGKRIRGVLVLAVADMIGCEKKVALRFAAAVEMIHASSLIHDDMPCMDNDTMRRGKPCTHIAFGESIALYAGLGLLNVAYEMLLENTGDMNEVKAVYELCKSAGISGIMKGQCLDIVNEGKEIDFDTLKNIHATKTGALIIASATVCAIASGCEKEVIDVLKSYGENIGTAFQIIDDVLDVTQTSADLGKTAGKDEKADKLTYVKVFGVNKATEIAEEHILKAKSCLDILNMDSGFLKETANLIVKRRN